MMSLGRILLTLGAAISLFSCDKNPVRGIPPGRPGSVNVGAAARAQSPHYKLIGTVGPRGGQQTGPSHLLQDGAYINRKN